MGSNKSLLLSILAFYACPQSLPCITLHIPKHLPKPPRVCSMPLAFRRFFAGIDDNTTPLKKIFFYLSGMFGEGFGEVWGVFLGAIWGEIVETCLGGWAGICRIFRLL